MSALQQSRSRLALLQRAELFREPAVRLRECAQWLDLTGEELDRRVRENLAARRIRLAEASSRLRLHRPDQLLTLFRQQLAGFRRRMSDRVAHAMSERRQRWERLAGMVRLLAPEATLARGYSLTRTEDGKVIRSVQQARRGTRVITRVSDGEFASEVSPERQGS
jgi:exodeoxyribonuclease VII large subunit